MAKYSYMNKQTKILLVLLTGVIILVVLSQFLIKKQSENSLFGNEGKRNITSDREAGLPTAALKKDNQSVLIDFGDGYKLSDYVEAQTAYDALTKLAKNKKITVETTNYKFGIMVNKIGEKKNSNDRSWIYYVNGKTAPIAGDRYILNPGDKIEWKYEKNK